MIKEGGRGEYRGVNLPKELMEDVDRIVDVKRFGFSSATDFVRSAVREKIHRYLPFIENDK